LVKYTYPGNGSLWLDEAVTVFHAQQSWTDIFNHSAQEPNPPLHYYLTALWIRLFGISETAVRSLSLVFHALAGGCLWWLLKKQTNTLWAYAGWLLFFLSIRFTWFALEARTYSLVTMLTVFSLTAFISYVHTKKNTWLWVLAISNALLLYSHYISFWIPLVEGLSTFLLFKDRRVFRLLMLAHGATLLAFAPFMRFALINMPDKSSFWLKSPEWSDWFEMHFRIWEGNTSLSWVYPLNLWCTLLLFLSALAMAIKRADRSRIALFTLLTVGSFLILPADYYLAQWTPVFLLKYVVYVRVFILVGLVISAHFLVSEVPKVRYITYSFLLLLIYSAYKDANWDKLNRGEPWEKSAEWILENREPGTPLILSEYYIYKPFLYYYDQAAFADYRNVQKFLKAEKIYLFNNYGGVKKYLLGHQRLYLIESHINEASDQNIAKNLSAIRKVEGLSLEGIKLYSFEKK